MDVYQHAQDIFSKMLGGMAAGGGHMPSAADAPKWAEMAMMYARAFQEKNANESKNII